MQKRVVILILVVWLGALALSGHVAKSEHLLRWNFLQKKVLAFASKYHDQDVIVVAKDAHLLFYCKKGRIVKGEKWNGFTYTFPVKVALASKYYWTPEGEMFIASKNPGSKYIRFLHFSYPGAYGIHSAETRYAAYLNRMEKKDPNFTFATLKDNTRGCVQVENRVVKYLFAQVDVKTPVLVLP